MTLRDAHPRHEGGADPRLRRLSELGEALRSPGDAPGPAASPPPALRLARAQAPGAETRSAPTPCLMLVLAGSASVTSAGSATRVEAGEILILPGRAPLELMLWPAAGGAFEALEVELPADALVRSLPADASLGGGAGVLVRSPSRATLAALAGFCEGVLEPTTHPRVLQHQLEGVLLALALDARGEPDALERERAGRDPTLAIRQLVRASPEHPWSLSELAHRLGLSQATLRRRLARSGTGLRRLVREERMRVGQSLLGEGSLNVAEVALRCGYGSPAKFARQFKHAFGVVPSRYRHRPGPAAAPAGAMQTGPGGERPS